MGAISGARCANPSRAHEDDTGFKGVCIVHFVQLYALTYSVPWSDVHDVQFVFNPFCFCRGFTIYLC